MKNYCMTIQYDGTRYSGWQRQTNTDKSVQGKLENVLSVMCGHKVEIHGSGRTDAGVHAKGQVASFKLETDKKACEIMDYLNSYLPEDIAVSSLSEAEERFHARLNAKEKTYVYRINNTNISPVFERKYMYQVKEKLDVEKMRMAAEKLLGTHDFLGFSSVKKAKKSTVRSIYDVKIETADTSSVSRGQPPFPCGDAPLLSASQTFPPTRGNQHQGEGSEVRIYITGDGFLYNMVRIITGTLIEIGLGERDIDSINEVLETKNREKAGFTAPARGLTLLEVKY